MPLLFLDPAVNPVIYNSWPFRLLPRDPRLPPSIAPHPSVSSPFLSNLPIPVLGCLNPYSPDGYDWALVYDQHHGDHEAADAYVAFYRRVLDPALYLGFGLLRADWLATTPLSLHRPAFAHDGSPVPERYRYIAHALVPRPLYPGFWKIFGDPALLMLGESMAIPGQINVFSSLWFAWQCSSCCCPPWHCGLTF